MPAEGCVRVLVDALNLKPGQGGIATYTVEVTRELARDPRLEMSVLTSDPEQFAGHSGARLVPVSRKLRRASARATWREVALPRVVRRERADVLFCPVPELPWRQLPVPSVAVIHDVAPQVEPAYFGLTKRVRCRLGLQATAARATALVAVSQTTANALATLRFGRTARVIPEGSDFRMIPGRAVADADGKPYVLHVGSIHPHKNVRAVLAAYSGDGVDRLVLVGPLDAAAERRLQRWRSELALDGRVEHRGFVGREELRELYVGGAAVVCPSIHEGFGLPALEAQSLGCPVIASDIPSAREVLGDTAILVPEPRDPGAWRTALDRVLGDAALRATLSRAGSTRAERFSWARCGSETAEVILEAAAGSAGPE